MSNPNPRTDQLAKYQQKPRWNHMPTKPIRVPEFFAQQAEAIAIAYAGYCGLGN